MFSTFCRTGQVLANIERGLSDCRPAFQSESLALREPRFEDVTRLQAVPAIGFTALRRKGLVARCLP